MNDQASVRYLVDKIEPATDFYTELLDLEVMFDASPDFVMLSRGPLRLMLNVVGGSGGASQPMPDDRELVERGAEPTDAGGLTCVTTSVRAARPGRSRASR